MTAHTHPAVEAIEAAAEEGRQAAREGRDFPTACPYLFCRFPGIEQEEFEVTKRPLMNAWFSAWKRASRQ